MIPTSQPPPPPPPPPPNPSKSGSDNNAAHTFENACQALFGPLHNQVSVSPEAARAAQDRRHLTVLELREYVRRLAVCGAISHTDDLLRLDNHHTTKTTTMSTKKLIHVAGTKGKGSTACLCEALCRVRYRQHTGLFTSPHLVDVRERIRVDGRPVSKQTFATAYWRIRTALEEYATAANDDSNKNELDDQLLFSSLPTLPGYFRMLTLVALYIFAHYQNPTLDVIILEVGMGGRYDATNLLDQHHNNLSDCFVSGVTLIDYDHVRVLGNTLEQIAWEKGGIFLVNKQEEDEERYISQRPDGKELSSVMMGRKRKHPTDKEKVDASPSEPDPSTATTAATTCFALDTNTPSVLEVLRQCARNEGRGQLLQLVGPHSPCAPQLAPFLPPQLGLAGDHQRHNALLAVAMVRRVMGDDDNNEDHQDDNQISLWHEALSHVSWPGRCQSVPVPNHPHATLYIDGAHTTQSIRVGFQWFQTSLQAKQNKAANPRQRTALLFYCSREKNPIPLFQELLVKKKPTDTKEDDKNDNALFEFFDVVCFCAPNAERPSLVPLKTAHELLQESGIETLSSPTPSSLPPNNTANADTTATTLASGWIHTMQTVWQHLTTQSQQQQQSQVVTTASSVTDALQHVILNEDCESSSIQIFATGSLYLAGSVLEAVSWSEPDAPGGLCK